jgi:aerobic carbon-monoxide dehydrogenase small subunit
MQMMPTEDPAASNASTAHWRAVVNGQPFERDVPADATLLDVLRDHCCLTGTKGACLEGECGSCTVLLDGQPVNSCLVLAMQVQDRTVTTVEGLAHEGRLHVLQQKFVEAGAAQCGYCTPGMILAAKALLDKNPRPSRRDIQESLAGNLCRCTGYIQILQAIERVARGEVGSPLSV